MSCDLFRLKPLGWQPFFAQQLTLEQLETHCPARVVGVGRDRLFVDTGEVVVETSLAGRLRHTAGHRAIDLPTVGDWVLVERVSGRVATRLSRRSIIHRRHSGGGSEPQAIAANVDRLVVVAALNREFNLHRIERYLVIAAHAEVVPLIVLTKADLCVDPAPFVAEIGRRLQGEGTVIAMNALVDDARVALGDWLGRETTLVLVGSSGVGKSTLLNNLASTPQQVTGATRRDDKGRHTTSSRSLHRLPGNLCVIDVPGLREVGLPPRLGGVSRRFAGIESRASTCRFGDCRHEDEPGCAVLAAVASGELGADELAHYRRLMAEEHRHAARQAAHHRRKARDFGKMVRSVQAHKRWRQGR